MFQHRLCPWWNLFWYSSLRYVIVPSEVVQIRVYGCFRIVCNTVATLETQCFGTQKINWPLHDPSELIQEPRN